MSGYGWAWLIVVAMGLVGGLATYSLLRPLRRTLRWWLTALVVAFFLAPAAIPKFDGYAPAFIVFVFEALFQTEGEPAAALIALLSALACASVVVLAASYWVGRNRSA